MATKLHNPLKAIQGMQEGLDEAVRKSLRERIIKQVEPIINTMVDEAFKDIKTSLEAYWKAKEQEYVVNVILEDRRAGDEHE